MSEPLIELKDIYKIYRMGDEEVRAQIQAVYDAGYEEWLLWDAGVSYHFGGV